MTTLSVLKEINDERRKQDEKWGQQNHPDGTGPADERSMGIAEAMRDSMRDLTDARAKDGSLTWRDILNEEILEAYAEAPNSTALRKELIQSAAVIVAWIEAIDRRNPVSAEESC